jgi:DegV family protein with EDD domain
MKVRIITDSACDLPKEIIEELDIEVLPLYVRLEGKEFKDCVEIEPKAVYEKMREGEFPTTAQISMPQFEECFTKHAKEGNSCVYIAFSSGLSGTYNTSTIIEKQIKETYPDFNLTTIDSKCASMGFGLVVYKAARMAKEGASKEEIVEKVRFYCEHMEHVFSVDSFETLVKGGRVSKTKGFIGTMLKIKPILDVEDGKLIPLEKARGKGKALKRLVELFGERGVDLENQIIGISHGDDIETALKAKEMIESEYGVKEVIISYIGCAIGAHSGPGCLALFCLNEKQENY